MQYLEGIKGIKLVHPYPKFFPQPVDNNNTTNNNNNTTTTRSKAGGKEGKEGGEGKEGKEEGSVGGEGRRVCSYFYFGVEVEKQKNPEHEGIDLSFAAKSFEEIALGWAERKESMGYEMKKQKRLVGGRGVGEGRRR